MYTVTFRILGSPAHVVSCATNKWRLSSNTVDDGIFSSLPQNLLGLGSLYQENGSPVLEPDTGNPYRVRVLGCPIRGMHPVPMLLEDIDRSFDGDLVTLSSCILKMCLRYVNNNRARATGSSYVKTIFNSFCNFITMWQSGRGKHNIGN